MHSKDPLRFIGQAADEVLAAHEIDRLPIDLHAIARQEEITLLPGDYDGCFDGRIEYRRKRGASRFYLLHAVPCPGLRTHGRVRFSIAHELGHFYIPEHRRLLLSGNRHGSHANFVSGKPMEREADYFASCLLMPGPFFTSEVERRSGRVCSLRELSSLAENLFHTSLTSTAIRYTELCFEACAVVLSHNHRVLYSIASQDMRARGLGWIERRSLVPPNTPTASLLATDEQDRTEREVDSDTWFEKRRGPPLWEEAQRLGRTGLILTLLSAPAE